MENGGGGGGGRTKSAAALRLSEQLARLSRDNPYENVELKSPSRYDAADPLHAADISLDMAVNNQNRAPAFSWPGVSAKVVDKSTPVSNLVDVIETDLVLGGSTAEGDMLKVVATRLSLSAGTRSSRSSAANSDDVAAAQSLAAAALSASSASSQRKASSQSRLSRFSQSLRRSLSKSDKSASSEQAVADKERQPSYSKTVGGSVTCRYCLDKMAPADNCSSCMCNGFLCESCLQGELQLTFSRANRVMHCTVCRHVFTISDMKEIRLPMPRFPRCRDSQGQCMRTSVVLPILMWVTFTSVYSFVDPDFSIIRGDVFFIAELATMAFALHFCWKSRELTRGWLRFLYAARAIRSLVVVIVWLYTWIDTIFLIFSIIFVLGSCLRRPDDQTSGFENRFALDVCVNDIGPMRLDQPGEWSTAPTFDMVASNQERAAGEREVQIARRRLGESLSENPRPMLSEDEVQTRADAMARFLGMGREIERERLERELEDAGEAAEVIAEEEAAEVEAPAAAEAPAAVVPSICRMREV